MLQLKDVDFTSRPATQLRAGQPGVPFAAADHDHPPYGAYQRLLERSELEGRSLSNLAAYLLEHAMSDP